MSRVRVHGFGVSLDGFGAGPAQSLENPLGVRGKELHSWVYPTRYFKNMIGESGGTTGVDNEFAERGFENIGAWILGRNMFAPSRGPWTDDGWKGWWGPNPPYHVAVYVLTHHARSPLEMEGGTTFHFVSDPIDVVLERAKKSAGGKDVRIGGGVATVRQYLQAKLIDEMHLAIAPTVLGQGEALFAGLDLNQLGYGVAKHVTTDAALHTVFERK